ncbi:MAG: hypothetical protein WKG52_10890 [Variovorax sp.]
MALSVVVVRALVVTQRDDLSEDAFGGPIGLSRWLIGGERPVAVCGFCRTVNRDSARFCKACDGKLPAFYAANQRPVGEPAEEGSATPAARSRLLPLLALAAAVLALFAAGWFWNEHRTAMALQEQAAPSLPLVMAPAPAQATAVLPLAAPLGPSDAALVDVRVDLSEPDPRPQSARRARVSGVGPASDGPLARCAGLNFFSRAICMNDSCAVRANGRHPQCADVVRQRRIDEARRNPLMAD